MRKLFKESKLFKGGNYMRKYGSCRDNCSRKYGIQGEKLFAEILYFEME